MKPYRARRVDYAGKVVQEVKQDNTVGDMPFLYGDKFEIDGKVYIVSDTATVEDVDGEQMLYGFAEVHPDSVSQSTGREDKHGVEAFGGDKVRSSHYGKGEILWSGDGWAVQAEDMKFALHYEFEIIPEGE